MRIPRLATQPKPGSPGFVTTLCRALVTSSALECRCLSQDGGTHVARHGQSRDYRSCCRDGHACGRLTWASCFQVRRKRLLRRLIVPQTTASCCQRAANALASNPWVLYLCLLLGSGRGARFARTQKLTLCNLAILQNLRVPMHLISATIPSMKV